MPDGTSRFSWRGQPVLHYMGCSTFSNFTVLPEIAVAKIRSDAPFDKVCYIGCGVTTGIGAVINTAKVEPGSRVVVFGLGGIGLNVIQGARMVGASQIVGVDLESGERQALAEQMGMTDYVNPREVSGRSRRPHLVELTRGGADYSFECIGNVKTMRQALECCHKGWGVSVIIGVAGAGQEIATRPFQLVTGRVWKGTAFGGARGRTDVPKIVDWYMSEKIEIDDLITHTMPLEKINDAFDRAPIRHCGACRPRCAAAREVRGISYGNDGDKGSDHGGHGLQGGGLGGARCGPAEAGHGGAGDRAGLESQSGARRRAKYPRDTRFHHWRSYRPRCSRPRCP